MYLPKTFRELEEYKLILKELYYTPFEGKEVEFFINGRWRKALILKETKNSYDVVFFDTALKHGLDVKELLKNLDSCCQIEDIKNTKYLKKVLKFRKLLRYKGYMFPTEIFIGYLWQRLRKKIDVYW